MRLFPSLFLCVIFLAGCASQASSWRDEALSRFNLAVAAGSQLSAPEETENVRRTMALADRYFTRQMQDDAERLYRLSCQESQLLYRNLMLNKAGRGAMPTAPDEALRRSVELPLAADPAVIDANEPDAGRQESRPAGRILPARSLEGSFSAPSSPIHEKNMSRRGIVARRLEPDRTTIYLTFDDGPSRLTLPIAAYLNSQGIAATFFAVGTNIRGHEKVVRDTIALGHRVGNHTLSHDLRKLNGSLSQGVNEIEKTAVMLDKLGGDGKMVRIPYGASSRPLKSAVALEGGEIFVWDIDSLDSSKRGVKDHAFIERTVKNQLQKNGKRHIIMLFHDGAGHDATYAAIRNLVPRLKREGYRFGLLARGDRVAQSGAERNQRP